VQPRAKAGGPITKILQSDLQISKNNKTWELLMSGPYLERLICHNFVVDVSQPAKKQNLSQVSTAQETIRYGPLVEEDTESEGSLKLVWPGVAMDAMQTAESLSLTYKDQNHSVCRTNDKKVSDVSLQKLYWNDITGIIATLDYWVKAKKHYDDVSGEIEDDDSFLDDRPPNIWFGSASGGGVTAGEKGCPSFASSHARKDAPDAYTGGGKKDTPENRALESVGRRGVSS
jgi:hypothetical protein